MLEEKKVPEVITVSSFLEYVLHARENAGHQDPKERG